MAKASLLLFVSLLCCLLSGLTTAKESPDPVRDVDGKILRGDTSYYILPAVHSQGGGITFDSRTCPLNVILDGQERSLGTPVTFSPANIKKGVIRLHTDLNVKFGWATPSCGWATVWKVDEYDSRKRQWFVKTGGSLGNPGQETLSNWFKIEEYGHAYKLVYCPSVCEECKVMCKDVGIFWDNGERRLALTNQPFKVVFKKAY